MQGRRNPGAAMKKSVLWVIERFVDGSWNPWTVCEHDMSKQAAQRKSGMLRRGAYPNNRFRVRAQEGHRRSPARPGGEPE